MKMAELKQEGSASEIVEKEAVVVAKQSNVALA